MRPANRVWWWPALVLMALLWWLSSTADPLGVSLAHPLDWAAHFLSYGALGFCLGRACGSLAAGWLLAAWFGALGEVHQAFVPGREAGIGDWWFDLLGGWAGSVVLGSGLREWWPGRAERRRTPYTDSD